jgi:hypothetical protein
VKNNTPSTTPHPSLHTNTNTPINLIPYIVTTRMDPSNLPHKTIQVIGFEKKPDTASITPAKILILTRGYMDYKTYYEPK